MSKVHMVMLLSCVLNVFALPVEHQRQTSKNNPQFQSSQQRPSLSDSDAGRRRRETSNNNFNTTLPRKLNNGDRIIISGKIRGSIKVHLLTYDKEVEGQLESDFDKKTITLKSTEEEVIQPHQYKEFEKNQSLKLSLTANYDSEIHIHGWEDSYLGCFWLKRNHTELMYMHILGDINNLTLTYRFESTLPTEPNYEPLK